MKRREFLIRAGQAVIAAPMVLTAISCGDEDGGPTSPIGQTGFSSTSSVDNSHSHSITIACANLTAGTDAEFTSSAASGHVHRINLSAGQLSQILANQSVGPVESENVFGHTHSWTIQKPSATCV